MGNVPSPSLKGSRNSYHKENENSYITAAGEHATFNLLTFRGLFQQI